MAYPKWSSIKPRGENDFGFITYVGLSPPSILAHAPSSTSRITSTAMPPSPGSHSAPVPLPQSQPPSPFSNEGGTSFLCLREALIKRLFISGRYGRVLPLPQNCSRDRETISKKAWLYLGHPCLAWSWRCSLFQEPQGGYHPLKPWGMSALCLSSICIQTTCQSLVWHSTATGPHSGSSQRHWSTRLHGRQLIPDSVTGSRSFSVEFISISSSLPLWIDRGAIYRCTMHQALS